MGSGAFLTYKDAGIREDAGRDGAVRHAAIPAFPVHWGNPSPGSPWPGHGVCVSSQLGSTEPKDKPATPPMVLQPQSWVSPPWSLYPAAR